MKTPFKFVRLASFLFALTVLAVACDLNQLTASNVVVATILSSPAIDVRGAAVAGTGLDASVPFDGGLPIDAGVTIPPQNLVTVFFGDKGAGLETAPTGIAGATVTLQQVGGGSFTLNDVGAGNYVLVDGGFTYTSGATYDFNIVHNNSTFIAEVANVPVQERVPAFHPAAGYVELTAGQPFAFTRPEPPSGQEPPLAFINVFAVSPQGASQDPTYTTVPATPLQFLKLVVAPSDWKKQQLEIPGTAFPDPDRNYVIILQSAKLGGPKSSNLFTGSAIIAGTADVAIVKTRP
ncbi:MAG: hypothetical protein AB1938_00250 [Myxococcota bacterium]